MHDDQRVLRRADAANYLGIGLTQFHQLILDGEIPPPTTLSGTVKVHYKEDLDAFLDRKRAESHSKIGEAAHV